MTTKIPESRHNTLLAINAACGAIIHMAMGLQHSHDLFRIIETDTTGVCQNLASLHAQALDQTLVALDSVMQSLGDCLNGGDAVDDIDEHATTGAFAVVAIALGKRLPDEEPRHE